MCCNRPSFRSFPRERLGGVEVDVRYPTYTFGDVLCTHKHYLDVHAYPRGSGPDRLLGRVTRGERCSCNER
jgi:hypothetical protein